MSGSDISLPTGFETLEPFVSTWLAPTAAGRSRLRLERSEEERVAFFNAVKDQVPAALSHLDAKPLAELDDSEQRLMGLLLTFAHVSLAVETQRDHEPRHAELRRHITITRAPADEHPAQ